jgi:hypothetical protein
MVVVVVVRKCLAFADLQAFRQPESSKATHEIVGNH